jgi:hypothetical protein
VLRPLLEELDEDLYKVNYWFLLGAVELSFPRL